MCIVIPYIAEAAKEDFEMENKITLPIGMETVSSFV